jgi:hypothetical protein
MARRIDQASAREMRTCESCGQTFEPARTDALFCSAACRQRAYRRRGGVTDNPGAALRIFPVGGSVTDNSAVADETGAPVTDNSAVADETGAPVTDNSGGLVTDKAGLRPETGPPPETGPCAGAETGPPLRLIESPRGPGRCAQCSDLRDGTETEFIIHGARVLLHKESMPYYTKLHDRWNQP